MIKHINSQNILTTPFIAVKERELFNAQNEDVVLIEPNSSSINTWNDFLTWNDSLTWEDLTLTPIPDTAVALEYIDYNGLFPIINSDCNIALEQQPEDQIIYEEGITGSGLFYPNSEPRNQDGTYKRLVHTQTKAAFYNTYNNPIEIFGIEYIDFPLSKTVRNIADDFRIFNIPQQIFGDRLTENTIQLFDNSLDDNVTITDDGYQNLNAGTNLFSKIQEIRYLGNLLTPGSSSFCYDQLIPKPPVLSGSVDGINIQNFLFWTTALSNSPILDYVLERSVFNTSSFTTFIITSPTVTSSYDTTISEGIPYSYRVYAANFIGNSFYSNIVTLMLPKDPILSGFVDVTNSQSFLFWTTASTTSSILNYVLERSVFDTSSFITFAVTSPTVTSSYDTTISGGILYNYRVHSINDDGNLLYSNIVALMLSKDPILSGSVDIVNSQNFLFWTTASSTSSVLNYVLERSVFDTSSFATFAITSPTVTSSYDATITASIPYSYRVYAINNDGNLLYSNIVTLILPGDLLKDLTGSLYISGPYDTFESYDTGSNPTNGGFGWDSAWNILIPGQPFFIVSGEDDFSTYIELSGSGAIGNLNGGWGWAPY
jgi:hypothetical protein